MFNNKAPSFSKGENVHHAIFGKGVVESIDANGRSVIINFPEHGRREFLMAFAGGRITSLDR